MECDIQEYRPFDILPTEITQLIRGFLGQCDLFALDMTCKSFFSCRPKCHYGIHPKVLACYYDYWPVICSLFWSNGFPTWRLFVNFNKKINKKKRY